MNTDSLSKSLIASLLEKTDLPFEFDAPLHEPRSVVLSLNIWNMASNLMPSSSSISSFSSAWGARVCLRSCFKRNESFSPWFFTSDGVWADLWFLPYLDSFYELLAGKKRSKFELLPVWSLLFYSPSDEALWWKLDIWIPVFCFLLLPLALPLPLSSLSVSNDCLLSISLSTSLSLSLSNSCTLISLAEFFMWSCNTYSYGCILPSLLEPNSLPSCLFSPMPRMTLPLNFVSCANGRWSCFVYWSVGLSSMVSSSSTMTSSDSTLFIESESGLS